jgi:hypothetical protein
MRVAAWQVVYPDVTVRHDPRCFAMLSNLTLGTLRVKIREEDRQKGHAELTARESEQR